MSTPSILEPPSTPTLYIPPGAVSLDKETVQQQRIGIQGYGGTGKSWLALQWPNPMVVNFDRGLGAHIGRADVHHIKFYDPDFVKRYHNSGDIKMAFEEWLNKEGPKLVKEQTLIVDSFSDLDNAYHANWRSAPVHSNTGKVNEFAEWQNKLVYFGDIFAKFKTLKCNVIILCHEAEKKDKTGEYTGKLRPLAQGSIADKIVPHFTDWFRMHAADKPKNVENEMTEDRLRLWGMTKTEFAAMLNEYPRGTHYFIQTESDNQFDGKCSSLVGFPRFIPAGYKWFCKYLRKASQ